MISRLTKEPFILLAGDIVAFSLALWLALLVRFRAIPPAWRLQAHFFPFLVVFALWVVVYFIFDLYRRQRSAYRRRTADVVARAHFSAALLSVLLFYLYPFFNLTPRVVLVLFTALSLALVLWWRLRIVDLFYRGPMERAVMLDTRAELIELRDELANNPKYRIDLIEGLSPEQFAARGVQVVIFDPTSPVFGQHRVALYQLTLRGARFVDARALYEEIFDRVPLALLDEGWFLANVTNTQKSFYDLAKRVMDLVIAIPLGLLSVLLLPFIYSAIRMDDGGPLFVKQERVGKNGKLFPLYKFRSMTGNDSGKYGAGGTTNLRVTRVGGFLRRTRLDEFPQLWSVIRGDQSLVGPRPELPPLAEVYRNEIPYYDVRHLLKPGLSGWAQIYHEQHPHHGTAVEQTRDKLSYDLYYVKNRSFALDLKIALKTIKTLLSVVGV